MDSVINASDVMIETDTAILMPRPAKRKGPKPGSKRPSKLVPDGVFVAEFCKVAKKGGTRADVVASLQKLGYDHVKLGTVTSRERYLADGVINKKTGIKMGGTINLPQLADGRTGGNGGGKRMDTESLNDLVNRLMADDATESEDSETDETEDTSEE